MNSSLNRDRSRLGGIVAVGIVVALSALPMTACAPSELLDVETPDIIDPGDVESPAGANAVRVGALARFTQATTGTESLLLLGGMFADEWVNGDTFTDRHGIDQRFINPANTFLTTATRNLHRARLSASQAIDLMDRYLPTAPAWQTAEMYFVQAYLENLAAESFCNGLVFSDVEDGVVQYGMPMTTTAAFERALGHVDDGLAFATGSTANDERARDALRITRGRILMNLDRPADAATAVASVPTGFQYEMFHSVSAFDNNIWNWNNLTRRYSVADNEGGNGLNFATANDPRVPVCEAPCPDVGVTSGTREDASRPLHVQLLWPARESTVSLLAGVDARMIEAEAHLRSGNAAAALDALNDARATVEGLDPLTDAGSDDARIDQLFRERAFWSFARGQRMGDLRRLVRQYGRAADSVFPTGEWHKAGATYGSDVNMPVPLAESNNPNVPVDPTCINRNI